MKTEAELHGVVVGNVYRSKISGKIQIITAVYQDNVGVVEIGQGGHLFGGLQSFPIYGQWEEQLHPEGGQLLTTAELDNINEFIKKRGK